LIALHSSFGGGGGGGGGGMQGTPRPTESKEINGKWQLLYTSQVGDSCISNNTLLSTWLQTKR